MTRQAQEEEKVRQLAIDYNKKMEKIKKSIIHFYQDFYQQLIFGMTNHSMVINFLVVAQQLIIDKFLFGLIHGIV